MSEIHSTPDTAAEALMGAVVDDFLDRHERGERPDVEEYARRYPQLATVLRQMLPALHAMHSAPPAIEPEGPLGDFRIVREVGRGGMGVVYEAVQISLGRRVALKVLPFAAALDSRQLQRFKNEAQAAAHLHHTNIVPVHAVGCERGVHYYAMQFIEGLSLAQVIADCRLQIADSKNKANPSLTPSASTICNLQSTICNSTGPAFFRAAARLGVQAAQALEHAHAQGVTHRDVKPANLLVDGQGKLWVTDFGLARVQADSRLTQTGDRVGTLRYMSPEQTLGQPGGLSHRTDLYSLGATLYELLTLEPAFTGRDHQDLLRQIAFEEPRPPRRINRAIPVELETIVLKAMAKDVADRYATAQELADDLERFLSDEPIRARRPTLVQRARQWARRHRSVVWSASLALLVVLAVLAGSVGWVVRDRTARQAKLADDVRAALEEGQRWRWEGKTAQALAAARRAEALLEAGAAGADLAGPVRTLLRELAEEEADRELVAHLEDIRLLQATVKNEEFALVSGLPHYREALTRYGLAPAAVTPQEAAALLRRRPAAVHGTVVASLDHYLILARYKKVPEERWLQRVLELADTDPWRRKVRAARARNDRPELEKLAREVDVAGQPAEALILLHMALWQRGARQGALALLRRAHAVFPGDFWINHDLGMALQDCQPPCYQEALRYLTAAVALRPTSAGVHLNQGRAFLACGRPDEALACFRKALALKRDFALAQKNIGIALLRKGLHDEAALAFRRLTRRQPASATAFYHLGCALDRAGRLPEAEAAYRRAIQLEPDHAEAHCNLGFVLRRRGEHAQALAAMKRGHELGSRRPGWRYPSGEWVRQCEQLAGRSAR